MARNDWDFITTLCRIIEWPARLLYSRPIKANMMPELDKRNWLGKGRYQFTAGIAFVNTFLEIRIIRIYI